MVFDYRQFFDTANRIISIRVAKLQIIFDEDRRFLISWISANAVAGLSIFIGIYLYSRSLSISHILFGGFAAFLSIIIGLVVLGFSFGIMQWRVLRQKINQDEGGGILWVLGTVISPFVGIFVVYFFKVILGLETWFWLESYIAFLVIGGTVLGTIQWLTLRTYGYRDMWWILTGIVGFSVSVEISRYIDTTHIFTFVTRTNNIVFSGVVSGIAGGALYGMITCFPLAWVLRTKSTKVKF